ncbi:MAG: hypothetical protein AAF942_04240 [Pseudomonadota bacterium]
MEIKRNWVKIATGIVLSGALAACTAEQVQKKMKETYVTGVNKHDQVISGAPADDGTSCYAKYRVPFYEEANNAAQAKSVIDGVGTYVTAMLTSRSGSNTYSQQIGTLLASNFRATMQSVVTDVQNDTTRINRLNKQFSALTSCRRTEAARINADYKAGKISQTVASQRMTTVRKVMSEDIAKARETNKRITARTDEFKLTAKTARKQVAAAPSRNERRERQQEVEKAEEAVQTNQKALNESVATVAQAETLVTETEGGFNLQSWLERMYRAPADIRRA